MTHDLSRYGDETQEREALETLESDLGMQLPPLGGYAMSPVGLALISRLAKDATSIVELGAGVSTLVLARTLELFNPGCRMVTIEHDARYLPDTETEVRVVPLVEVAPGQWWYDPWGLEDVGGIDGVDLLVVDGPPKRTCRMARFPAWPMMQNLFHEGGKIVVDDADRDDEKLMISLWGLDWPFWVEHGWERQSVLTV